MSQGSTGPGEHRKKNKESEEEKAEGVWLMDDTLAPFYFQLSTQCMVFTKDVPSTTLEGALLYPLSSGSRDGWKQPALSPACPRLCRSQPSGQSQGTGKQRTTASQLTFAG